MKIKVYLKGGNPLGIQVLKMLSEKYPDRETFGKYFDKFLELGLIKDWDFHCYSQIEIDDNYREKLDKLAKEHRLVSRGSKFILYQTRKPIQILDTALFEVSIWDGDNYSDLESVMSTMKIKVTEYNLKYIFMFAKSFYSYIEKKEPIDIDVIYRMIKKIDVIMYPHLDGFFIIDERNFNDGGLSGDMLNFIRSFRDKHKLNKNIDQFLIAHIKEPKRMYFRLLEKNIPKAEKIYKFLIDTKIVSSVPQWLFDSKKLINIVNEFTKDLHQMIMLKYQEGGLSEVLGFLHGVNFKPLKDEFDRFSKQGLDLVRQLLGDLYIKILAKDKVNDKDIKEMKDINERNLFTTLKFLESKGLFK